MDIYHVSPQQVLIMRNPSERGIRHQMRRLVHEGQIEPFVVKPPQNGTYALNPDHPDYFHYTPELVIAAIRLKWNDVLVTY